MNMKPLRKIFYDACFAAGMCCLRLASEGGELNRERLAIELMQLFKLKQRRMFLFFAVRH